MRSLIKKFLSIQMLMVLVFSQTGFCQDSGCDPLDRMERGEIKHGFSSQALSEPQPISWTQVASAPVLFVTTLLEPFTHLVSTCTSSLRSKLSNFEKAALWDHLESGKGIEDYGALQKAQGLVKQLAGDMKATAMSFGEAIKNNPLESTSMGVGLVVGWTDIAEVAPMTTAVVGGVISSVRNSKTLYSLAQSIDGDKFVERLLKVGLYAGAIYTVAALPAAAAMSSLKGSFQDSCRIIEEKEFSSSDPNIKGDFVFLKAECRFDREVHGMKQNTLVVPQGGPCGYLSNINGTIVASDDYDSAVGQIGYRQENNCPQLAGSFLKTCEMATGMPYKSSDSRIPVGSICEYTVIDCKTKVWKNPGKSNTLRIPAAEVGCHGSRIENCDGQLVVRKSGQSDHQCDDFGGSKLKSEL